MTDKVADFFKDVKERFSSPLFSSFIIAWLIINWKIPVALFWYDQKLLRQDGYSSYMDLITKISSRWNYVWWPLFLAVLYTFGYPILRNVVLAANAWARKWGTDWVINVSKESKVPMRAFLQLREKYYKQTRLLEQVVGEENSFRDENTGLKSKILEMEAQTNKYLLETNKWTSRNQIAALNGEWECTIVLDKNTPKADRFRFRNGNIRIYNISGEGRYQEFQYNNYSYNPNSKKISLDIQPSDGRERWYYLLEDKGTDLTELEGVVYKMQNVVADGIYRFNTYPVTFRKFESTIIEEEKTNKNHDSAS